MKPAAQKALILTIFGVVVAALVVWQVIRLSRPRAYELKSATVTKLDADQRSGEIEFTHPKSGRSMTIAAQHIPADCEITIDEVPAVLADVHVGDRVAVQGLIHVDHTVQPQRIRVTRGGSATEPATRPASVAAKP